MSGHDRWLDPHDAQDGSAPPDDGQTREMEALIAGLAVLTTLGEAIRELGTVPEGELFARLAGLLDLDTFTRAIGALVTAGLISRTNHLLTWIGR